jgi:hypothetical protein
LNPQIFGVDENGIVTPVAPGKGIATATYAIGDQIVQANVPVTVSQGALASSTYAVSFPNQAVNTTGNPQTVTVTNNTHGPVSILGVTVTGDYFETDNCKTLSPIPTGENCVVTIGFGPTVAGTRVGKLFVTNSFDSGRLILTLTGNGQ